MDNMRSLTDEPGHPKLHDPAAVERASEDDRRWFKDHPGAIMRERPEVSGELPRIGPPLDPGEVWVRVRQILPGLRIRQRYAIFFPDEGEQE